MDESIETMIVSDVLEGSNKKLKANKSKKIE